MKPPTSHESPRNTVHSTDCIEGMRQLLRPEEVDVIVTSPPYNIGVGYGTYNDAIPRAEYLEWMGAVAQECKRVLAREGSFFLNLGQKPRDPWVAWEVAFQLRKLFTLQNVLVWVKSIAVDREDLSKAAALGEDVTFGHFKPISGERFLNDSYEYVFHFTKTGKVKLNRLAVGVPYQDKSNIGRWKSVKGDLRCRGNTWFVPYETIQERATERPHPSTFPVKLPLMCIKLHGVERTRLVLDPFTGIGNTAIACLRLGVDFIGFEIDQNYVRIAKQRLRAERARLKEE
jgi:site-specific DNA-methyltransferase (adenine-specific)